MDRSAHKFESPLLEKLSRVHPAVPICVWGPLALGLIYLGQRMAIPGPALAGLVISGLLVWTLVEYILHRWIFHWEPKRPALRKFVFPMHQLHHEVQEWDRLVAPPLLAVPLWLTFLGLFWLILDTPAVFPFFGGFTIGYLMYDYIHFHTHFGQSRSRLAKSLRRRHLQHHFACPDRWYGVSSPLWDYVFRTHLRRGERPAQFH